ncbi:unnamed protein product, partial [Closterium sp. NIES-54]
MGPSWPSQQRAAAFVSVTCRPASSGCTCLWRACRRSPSHPRARTCRYAGTYACSMAWQVTGVGEVSQLCQHSSQQVAGVCGCMPLEGVQALACSPKGSYLQVAGVRCAPVRAGWVFACIGKSIAIASLQFFRPLGTCGQHMTLSLAWHVSPLHHHHQLAVRL